MSSMNTLPQTPKSFDRFEGQDHGTRGNTVIRQDEVYLEGYATTNKEAKDKAFAQYASHDVTQGVDDYLDSLSPAQLEDVATSILEGEDFAYKIPTESGSNIVFDSTLEQDIQDAQERLRIEAEEEQEAEYEFAQASIAEVSGMGEQLDINTPARVRKEMARNAMLDPANDEDDLGDFPTQPVRRIN